MLIALFKLPFIVVILKLLINVHGTFFTVSVMLWNKVQYKVFFPVLSRLMKRIVRDFGNLDADELVPDLDDIDLEAALQPSPMQMMQMQQAHDKDLKEMELQFKYFDSLLDADIKEAEMSVNFTDNLLTKAATNARTDDTGSSNQTP